MSFDHNAITDEVLAGVDLSRVRANRLDRLTRQAQLTNGHANAALRILGKNAPRGRHKRRSHHAPCKNLR